MKTFVKHFFHLDAKFYSIKGTIIIMVFCILKMDSAHRGFYIQQFLKKINKKNLVSKTLNHFMWFLLCMISLMEFKMTSVRNNFRV